MKRRDFLKLSSSIAAAAATPALGRGKASATDWVTLGNSGVKVTRLAFGTGTHGGRIQRELGQEGFTRLVRHAYDNGVRFFESAGSYGGMHDMLAIALKGIPRDSYRLMTKIRPRDGADCKAVMDQYRKQFNSDYFDILLVHCVRSYNWPEECKRQMDEYREFKSKKLILAHGASCHGLLPLKHFPGNSFLDVALLRVNHDGTRMDTLEGDGPNKGDRPQVLSQLAKVHAQRTGVIGMKLIGEGRFKTPEERDASIRAVMKLGTVDAVTIGYKSTAEIDEAITRINTHLNS